MGSPQHLGHPESEYWILPRLISHPTFEGSNAVFVAMWALQHPFVLRSLLDAGWGRRDNTPPGSWDMKMRGSEVAFAVRSDCPELPLLLEYGLGLECEDSIGYTALLHAIEKGNGCTHFVRVLISAGADVVRRTASGNTPLELAAKNLRSTHPRLPKYQWSYTYGDVQPVSS